MLDFRLRKRKRFAALSTLVVLFLITACGGGGGGGGGGDNNTTNNAALAGNYRGGVFGIDSGGTWTDLVDVSFDGAGHFTGASAVEGPISGTYAVQSDRVLTADNEAGQLRQDGAIFHLVDTDPSDLSISIGIKQSSGMSEADLDGTYQTFVLFSENDYDFTASRFAFTFEGDGSFSYSGLSYSETDSGSYTVADDGAIDLDQVGEGQVSTNGDIFFFAGPGYLAIGIRQSTGMTTADLAGTFHAIVLTDDEAIDDDAGSLSAVRGNISSDGSGNLTITLIDPPDSPSSGTGTVDDDGTITGPPNIGQLSPDTGFFIVTDDGTLDMDDDYEIVIGILKP